MVTHALFLFMSTSCEIVLRWITQNLTDGKSTCVQVMAWCHQAASHYLSYCWSRFLSLGHNELISIWKKSDFDKRQKKIRETINECQLWSKNWIKIRILITVPQEYSVLEGLTDLTRYIVNGSTKIVSWQQLNYCPRYPMRFWFQHHEN